VYLGGTVSADQSCDEDIERRIGLAAGIVMKLGKIWTAKDISKVTKVTLCKTLVQLVVLYNAPSLDTEAGTPEETASVWDGGAEEKL